MTEALLDAGAAELAAALRARVTPVSAHVGAVLGRIARRDAHLTAISQVRAAGALADAAALDALPDEAAARLRAAGAVVVATTHMSEFGQTPFTDGWWGATANPWDAARSSGGSSGGSAVAVAARLVPLALGGDSGGSIRIPSAWCGVYGLKPGRGRLPTDPFPNLWYRLGTYGPMARSVGDLRLAQSVLGGGARQGARALLPGAAAQAVGAGGAGGRLRVGWTTSCPLPWVRATAEVAGAVETAARVLAARGHTVSRGSVRWTGSPAAFLAQCYRGCSTRPAGPIAPTSWNDAPGRPPPWGGW